MRNLDKLRSATNDEILRVVYESVERVKSQLDSNTYCDMMNATLVMRERLNLSSFMEPSEDVVHDVDRSPPPVSGPLSEQEREERIMNAVYMKHAIEREMTEYRRKYRRSHRNILRTIGKLERQRRDPFRDESPIII